MKHLLWIAVLVVGCKKKDAEQAPAPEPKPVAPAPAPAVVAAPTPPPAPAGPCNVKLTVRASTLGYEGTDAKGETPLSANKDPDLSALDKLRACSAQVVADKDVQYQSVVHVIDSLTRFGFNDISVGEGTPSPAPGPKITSEKTADGTIIGHIEQPSADLSKVPVIVMSKTTVVVAGKDLKQPPTAADIGKAIETALAAKGKPTDPRVILQADQSLPANAVIAAIDAAKHAGYDNVLFAVKNK